MASREPAAALGGIRVLDFTWSVAGPTITTILAAAGAEVIKVEWPDNPDPMRDTLWADDVPRTPDSACFFAYVNPGKKGFAVNARSEEGHGILEDMIRESDLVVESFSAGVMEKWGLGYDRQRELRPDIIYLSLSGFGHSGRYHEYSTWGPTAQAFNGVSAMGGLPDRHPSGWGLSYMDLSAGYMATVALLSALHHRARTGEGQHIDVAQTETGLSFGGSTVLAASLGRPDPGGTPPGNRAVWPGSPAVSRGEYGAPYNLYPTREGGRFGYCAITVLDDAQWRALVAAMGRPGWALDEAYAMAEGRVAAQDALDERIAEWTRTRGKHELMDELQAAGVPAGALQSFSEIVDADPQLAARDVFPRATHPLLGERKWESFPARLSRTPLRVNAVWPRLGQDTAALLRDVLGRTDDDIAGLVDRGVVRVARGGAA